MLLTRKLRNLLKSSTRHASKITQQQRKIIQDVDSLKEHSLKSKRNHLKVYVWGLAETGALGIANPLKVHAKKNHHVVQHPTRLSFGEGFDVLDVSAGYGFTIFTVKSTDDCVSLFGTGINTDSQIGYHKHGGATNKPIEIMINPAPIVLPRNSQDEKIQAVKTAAGRAHTVVLADDGSLFTLGNNAYGQSARKIVEDEEYFGSQVIHRLDPDLFSNERVVDVVCGQDHSIFVTESGRVFSCGWGADGQTGLGHYNNHDRPEIVVGDIKDEKIVKTSSAGDCVLALNDKGEVFGWGNSEYGQISHNQEVQQISTPTNLKYFDGLGKIIDVAASGSACAVLNEAGDVFVWGFGILGFGPAVDHAKTPKQIPPTLFGRNPFNPQCRVTSISCGLYHFAAINSDKDLFTWGRNKYGCLGLGHQKDQFFPFKTSLGAKVERVSCGADHMVAMCKSFN